jgi:nucleotidyltransferase substrate binding protein (TIGR01987 family)
MEYKLDLTPLTKAFEAFSGVLSRSGELEKDFYDVYRSAVIQNFEFSFELCWKFMRRWLEIEDLSEVDRTLTKKDLFRLAHKSGLVDNAEKWFEYLSARNRTSHVYDEDIADEVFMLAKDFYPDFKKFIRELEKRA